MEGELVSGSPSPKGESNTPPSLYSDIFREHLPYYIFLGMTPEQFWNEDCTLVKAYREAHDFQVESKNQELWLQGLYIYEALLTASPVFHDFAKKGTKPLPYSSKPYPITEKAQRLDKEAKEKLELEKRKAYVEGWMKRVNAKFTGENQDGRT